MNILIIDSTTDSLCIALIINNKYDYIIENNNKKHNSNIMTDIEKILIKNKIEICEINLIACVNGPGSFTGIRLGVNIANGIAYARKIKIIPLSAFDILSYDEKESDFISAIDCKNDNFYFARFENGKLIESGDTNKEFLNKYKGKIIYQDNNYKIENLVSAVKSKFNDNELTEFISPLYLKKSQAERLINEYNKN